MPSTLLSFVSLSLLFKLAQFLQLVKLILVLGTTYVRTLLPLGETLPSLILFIIYIFESQCRRRLFH